MILAVTARAAQRSERAAYRASSSVWRGRTSRQQRSWPKRRDLLSHRTFCLLLGLQMSEGKGIKVKTRTEVYEMDTGTTAWRNDQDHCKSDKQSEGTSVTVNTAMPERASECQAEEAPLIEDQNERKLSECTTSSSHFDKGCTQLTYRGKKMLSHHKSTEDECASLILTCLFCQFCDFLFMLPRTCETIVTNICCPSHRYYYASDEDLLHNEGNSSCDVDCSIFDACHDTSECLELALEISQMCYH
ncbi:myoD family inhibitor domain-containing protein 2 [Ambystoma mexicanum]|uniref:myoD family inhibitor domain-containing protein 2 n=1 Tax=Ambystoma mexicanum TaxID=8296 RepID=UPI0037E71826